MKKYAAWLNGDSGARVISLISAGRLDHHSLDPVYNVASMWNIYGQCEMRALNDGPETLIKVPSRPDRSTKERTSSNGSSTHHPKRPKTSSSISRTRLRSRRASAPPGVSCAALTSPSNWRSAALWWS